MYQFLLVMNMVNPSINRCITSRISKPMKRRGFELFYDDALTEYGSHFANRTLVYVSSVMNWVMLAHELLIYCVS